VKAVPSSKIQYQDFLSFTTSAFLRLVLLFPVEDIHQFQKAKSYQKNEKKIFFSLLLPIWVTQGIKNARLNEEADVLIICPVNESWHGAYSHLLLIQLALSVILRPMIQG
jgi:hypothetical protein